MTPIIGESNKDFQYHDEIIIFLYLNTGIMIFNRIPNINEYTILKILRKFQWTVEPLDGSLFTTPISQVHGNIEKLYSDLSAKCSKLYEERYVDLFYPCINLDEFLIDRRS